MRDETDVQAEWIQFWSNPQEEHKNSVIENPAPNAVTLAVFVHSEHSLWQMCHLLETTRRENGHFLQTLT